jgi:phospholipid/cholesterol/gamma-HCH transport system substrate-binding protein
MEPIEPTRNRLPRFESVAGKRVLGILVLALGIAGLTYVVLRPSPFADTRTFIAEFESAQGIGRVDRNIRVAGTNVGEIGEVARVGDDARVELVIEGDVPVKQDARAELKPHTLFEGSAFIDLHPGSPSAPALEQGGTIPRERTEVYVSLDEALRVLHEPTREALQDLADVGAKTLKPEAIRGLQRTLRAAPSLTKSLKPTARALQGPERRELASAIVGLAKTTQGVAWREADLLPLVQGTRRTLAAVNVDGGRALDAGLAALPGVLEQLAEGGPRLERVIDRIDLLAVRLQPALVDLAELQRALQPVLRRGTPVLRASLPLVENLRLVLARTAAAGPGLFDLLKAIRPGAKVLEESVLPFLNSDSRLGLPVYLQLISAFTGANAAQRPYQTEAQGPLGEGHVLRLGAYFDPGGFPGGPPSPFNAPANASAPESETGSGSRADCDELAYGNAAAARRLEKLGACG